MCFDSAGHIKWVTEGLSWMTLSSATPGIDSASNLFFTGSFRDSIVFTGHKLTTWPGLKDMFIVKMDQNGMVKWAHQTRSSICAGEKIITDKAGNSYVTGYFKGLGHFGNYDVLSYTSQDAFLARYDSSGECLGVIHFPNGEGDGISQDANGNPAFICTFIGSTSAGGNQYQSYGNYSDLLFIKCSAITSIGEPKPEKEDRLLIYANPTTGKCTITIPAEFLNEKHLALQIFDSQGKLVQQAPIEKVDGKINLTIETQSRGMYNAILSNARKSYSGKIIFR
jgi:hypothetical protein